MKTSRRIKKFECKKVILTRVRIGDVVLSEPNHVLCAENSEYHYRKLLTKKKIKEIESCFPEDSNVLFKIQSHGGNQVK